MLYSGTVCIAVVLTYCTGWIGDCRTERQGLIPCHALAVELGYWYRMLCEEISYEQAIVYLRKEAVTLSDAAPRGVVLLTYKHVPRLCQEYR